MTREQKRKYMKEYHLRRKAEKANGGSTKTSNDVELVEVINAYRTLHKATNDGTIKADINKILSSIILKLS